MDGPKEEIGVNACVGRHIAFMAIRYNRWFRKTAGVRLIRAVAITRVDGSRWTVTIPTEFMTREVLVKS